MHTAHAKGTAMRNDGFSLIELLVVVVIIGILGAVGILGYQAYISQTRDATTKDNFEFLKRTLDQDILSVSNDLNARSKFSEGLTKSSQCYVLRDRYIRDMNLERSNPFDKSKGQVCDGNHFMSHTLESNPSAQTVTIKRGQTMVYCTGTDIQNASWKTVSNKLGLKFCTCTGLEECTTTQRYKGVLKDNITASNTAFSLSIINPNISDITSASSRMTFLLIGDERVSVDFWSTTNGVEHVVDINGLAASKAANTAVYEVNPDVCYTPLGETTKALYMSTFSDFPAPLDSRHTCY